MADDLSLLLKIKGDAAGGKAAVAETRAAIASLRTGFSNDFGSMQGVATAALGKVTQSLTGLTNQVPLVGSVVNSLSAGLSSMATEGTAAAGSLASMAGPAGAAVLALGAMVAASVIVTKQLFNMAQAAAEFRGKMFDLSQQTGVSVETLSALEIVAKTTGGSIESIAQSLVIFQGKLDEAQDSSSKAGKQFEELGISTNNTEDAFRDALTQLAKMPEGFHQTNTAAELFGRRGGKQVLAIIKELDGDLDGAIARFRELGLVISKEDAEAADKLNDQLAILQFQFRALLGNDVIPAALKAVEDLSKALKDNKAATDAAGKALGIFASIIGSQFSRDLTTVNSVLEAQTQLYERMVLALQKIATILPGRVLPSNIAPLGVPPEAIAGAGGRRGISPADAAREAEEATKTAISTMDAAEKAAQARLKGALARAGDVAAGELEIERFLREGLRLEFEKRNSDLEAHYQREQALVDMHLASLNKQIADERSAIQAGFENRAIDEEEFGNRKRDLDRRATQAKNKASEETQRLSFEKQQALDKQEIELRERQSAIAETRRKGEMDRLKAAREREAITESDLITKQLEFLKEAQEERIGILNFEINALSTSTEQKKKLDAEKTKSEQEYTDAVKALTRERIDARNLEATQPGGPLAPPSATRSDAGAVGRDIEGQSGLPPILAGTTSAIEQLFGAVHDNLSGDKQTAALAGLEAMVETFGRLGDAVGQAVYAFVLYGSAGTSVRKVTAQILASVAQMAAIKAIFELAEGFAALALAFFGIPNAGPSATAHFVAAGVYASIAGVAAVAGRFAAGDSFTKQAGASGGSGGGGNTSRSGQPATREADRRSGFTAAEPQTLTQVIEYKIKGDVVVDHFERDYMLNGRTRVIIKGEN